MEFWATLGTNSSQIQTILAVLGLVLAGMSINHGLKQMRIANEQREFSLKHQVLSECFSIIKRLEELEYKIQQFQMDIVKNLLSESDLSVKLNLAQLFNSNSEILLTTLNQSNLIKKLANKFHEKNKKFTISDMETITQSQLGILNWIVNIEGSIRGTIYEFQNPSDVAHEIINSLQSHQT